MIYGIKDLKSDPTLLRLASLAPGTEVEESVYMALKTRVHPLRLPDSTRMKSPLGISEGYLFGRLWMWQNRDRMFLAFGMSLRKGKHYYYLGLSPDTEKLSRQAELKKALSNPALLAKMMRR